MGQSRIMPMWEKHSSTLQRNQKSPAYSMISRRARLSNLPVLTKRLNDIPESCYRPSHPRQTRPPTPRAGTRLVADFSPVSIHPCPLQSNFLRTTEYMPISGPIPSILAYNEWIVIEGPRPGEWIGIHTPSRAGLSQLAGGKPSG